MSFLNNWKVSNSLSDVTVHGTLSISSSANIYWASSEYMALHSQRQRWAALILPANAGLLSGWLPHSINWCPSCLKKSILLPEYNSLFPWSSVSFGRLWQHRARIWFSVFMIMLMTFSTLSIRNWDVLVSCSGRRSQGRDWGSGMASATHWAGDRPVTENQ